MAVANKNNLEKIAKLRKKAEKIARKRSVKSPVNLKSMNTNETLEMLHELQVHQIELEMQNEELRISQLELERSRERYFDLYDLAPVAYCTISEKGLILEANLTAAKLLGVSRGELNNQLLSQFILPKDQDIFFLFSKKLFKTYSTASGEDQKKSSPISNDFRGKEEQGGELRMLKKDGSTLWIHLAGAVGKDGDGGLVCRIVMDDITERKQLEEEAVKLEEQNSQLQKAESLNRMAGAIAHHFNNQLQVVLGYLDLVIGNLPPDDSSAEQLSIAMRAAKKASEVSSLMLTYLGQKPGQMETVALGEFCRITLPILQEGVPEGVILETDFPSSGPDINADIKQIQLLMTNVVSNAWETMGTGKILLSIRTVPAADIPVTHRFPVEWQAREESYACLEVKDSGSGIPKENIEKLFDPFFSTKFAGRGLGLSVVLGIVRAHNGVITVNNRNKGGSVFRMFFPLAVQVIPRTIERVSKVPKTEPGGTILLVEDEKAIREMTARILENMGFLVLQAKDGVEAIEVFKQHKNKISCLISDLTMPRMGGWETISALRVIRPDLPVVLASGYNEASVMAGEHAELPDFFLNKPYNQETLSDKIGHAIARRSIAKTKRGKVN